MRIAEAVVQIELVLRGERLPPPVREHRFHKTRKWRFDFAWPARMLALEFEGGVYARGRQGHLSVRRFNADCEKYNEAALLGWRVIRMTRAHLDSGQWVEWIRRGLSEGDGE